MKLLHLDSSIQADASASRLLSAAIVEHLARTHPAIEIGRRDLAAEPLPHLTLDQFGSAESSAVLDEFLAADILVIGAPMYNLGIPSQLKAWFDRIMIAGATFRYTANGPEGLVGDKRVILAVSRGGFYGAASPAAGFEHAESHLRAMLALMGITDPEIIIAEGIAVGPEQREAALAAASAELATIAPVVRAAA